jgi:hypothetical protein
VIDVRQPIAAGADAVGQVPEACCICLSPTTYRYGDQQVSCCEYCARFATAEMIPAKGSWSALQDVRSRSRTSRPAAARTYQEFDLSIDSDEARAE